MDDRPEFDSPPCEDEDDKLPAPTWVDNYYAWFNRYAEETARWLRAMGFM